MQRLNKVRLSGRAGEKYLAMNITEDTITNLC